MEENEYVEMTLPKLKLRSGIAVQTQSSAPGASREEARFLAAVDGKGVMMTHEGRSTMEIGAEYLISGFTGQYDFQFSSKVIQTFEAPFAYALLDYPKSVKARMIRRAARMKISLPAKVATLDESRIVDAMLADISVLGAMFRVPNPVGNVGEVIILCLSFPFENQTASLRLPSSICYSNRADSGSINVGVSFKGMSQNDKMMLYYLTQSITDQQVVM